MSAPDPMEKIAEAARLLESIPTDELERLRAESSRLAGELDRPAAVRRFFAVLAIAAEGAADGLVDWDVLLDLGAASKNS